MYVHYVRFYFLSGKPVIIQYIYLNVSLIVNRCAIARKIIREWFSYFISDLAGHFH